MDTSSFPVPPSRLYQQLAFLAEIDKLKDILRRSVVGATARQENSAEHSWHLSMMALVLMEHSSLPNLDQARVLKMLLIHDIVEIDAGDTFYYDVSGQAAKAEKEITAAARIFALLPEDQGPAMRQLWEEFEAGVTPESRVAQALDRLQAVLQNLRTNAHAWRKYGVTKDQILARNQKIGEVLPEVWAEVSHQIEIAAGEQGNFMPGK